MYKTKRRCNRFSEISGGEQYFLVQCWDRITKQLWIKRLCRFQVIICYRNNAQSRDMITTKKNACKLNCYCIISTVALLYFYHQQLQISFLNMRFSILHFQIIIGGSESHLSGCYRLFGPKFWEVVRTYEWYFVILWMQDEWWGH